MVPKRRWCSDRANVSFINTALSVLNQVESVIAEVQSAFTIGIALVQAPAVLVSAFAGWCSGLVGSLTALPLASEYSLASLLPGIVATPTDPGATAGAIVGVTGAYAHAIVDGTVSSASDPTGGLADLATWGADILAANTGGTPTLAQQAANAQATVDLVRGAAVAGAGTVYAGIDWTSANAAAAARDQFTGLIEDRTAAAAAAGQDALYAAWQALESIALQDLPQRVQQLPQLITYTRPSPPTAVALAYRLYQDAMRAMQLVQLNDAPHPLFMPLSGQALAR